MAQQLLDSDETARKTGTIEMISRPKVPLYPPCTVCGRRSLRVTRFDTDKNRIILICNECMTKIEVGVTTPAKGGDAM